MEIPKDFRDIFDRGHALIANALYRKGWLQRPGTGYDPVGRAWPDHKPFAVVELRRLNGAVQGAATTENSMRRALAQKWAALGNVSLQAALASRRVGVMFEWADSVCTPQQTSALILAGYRPWQREDGLHVGVRIRVILANADELPATYKALRYELVSPLEKKPA